MYRVAVIQNESEMQRTGYANVIAKLKTINRFKENYEFDLYTVVNLRDLFERGHNHLCRYDSLIITTNATSDKIAYKILVDNKETIEKFIQNGKGIFIASQKKLSTALNKENKQDNEKALTHFLPIKYDFYTARRPKNDSDNDDSGVGKISFGQENEILLKYPETITEQKTNQMCESNAFMKHFYRSHIQPVEDITYTPVLVDKGDSYSETDNKFVRNLLMINAFPEYGEKIVISTIAVDWEYHKNLLTNIITFITEGLPQIAFIDKDSNSNIKCLIESANILKKAHTKYNNLNSIDETGKNIHNIYVFSNGYTETEITTFLNTIDTQANFIKKRVYWINEENSILKLIRYSNYNSIDRIISNSVSWLESQHPLKSGMWNNSFWTTFEILLLFSNLKIDLNAYITTVLQDIKTHYNPDKHSYDGVVSATCGLIQLLCLLKEKNCEQSVFTDDDLKGMIGWIKENSRFNAQSSFDKRNIVLALSCIKNNLSDYSITKDEYNGMINSALNIPENENKEYSEIDICQIISTCLLNQETSGENIKNRLEEIKNKQTSLGAWNNLKDRHDNIGRTAQVIIFLIQKSDSLKTYINENELENIIYRGILFLRSKYNNKNWGDEDIQATAKAAHAIFLYNERNHASMYDYDVLKIIEEENSEITFSEIIKDLTNNLRKYQDAYNTLKTEKESLQNGNETLNDMNKHLKSDFAKSKKINAAITYILIIIVAILFTFLSKGIIDNNIYYSIIAGFITAIILGLANFAVQNFNKISSKSKNKN